MAEEGINNQLSGSTESLNSMLLRNPSQEHPENSGWVGKLTVDKEEVLVGETLTISWNIPTVPDHRDWIGLYPAG